MPRVFVYEFVCGGGWQAVDPQESPPESLLREGRAMLRALVTDFAAISDVRVVTLRDARLSEPAMADCDVREVHSAAEERNTICELAADADWTVLIAPEFARLLFERARWVEESGGRLLSPSAEVIAICTDKQRTAELLQAAGVPTPHGLPLDSLSVPPRGFSYPAVLKPRDGAGSQGVRWIHDKASFRDVAHEAAEQTTTEAGWRLEQYCPGLAASVALLCGPAGCFALPPCSQRLSDDEQFRYLGGTCPLPSEYGTRAKNLARRAVATLPNPSGYIGVDLVLGDDPTGSDDYVIEINPRLTTSYVGLRGLAKSNLADAMLAVVNGWQPDLEFSSDRLEFDTEGKMSKPEQTFYASLSPSP